MKGFDKFTKRENDVLQHLVQGEPNKIIAQELGIVLVTVKMHVARMMMKTGCKNRVDLAVNAVRREYD